MLQDPAEAMPPSNKRALKHFIKAGKELGIEVDPVTRNDFARLAEYDACSSARPPRSATTPIALRTAPSAKAWW
jgi:glutathione synthase/RimK-type ligase-like ATP-grasp enzyme